MMMRHSLTFLFCLFAFSAFAQVPAPVPEVDVAVPAHEIARGAVLSESDLTYKAVPSTRANESIARSIADLVGLEARRALRTGELIRTIDVKPHALVAKGATVTMVFESGGVTLSSTGRAMADGAEGDVISVLNPTSYGQVQAMVIAPGRVRIGAAPKPSRVAITASH